MSSGLPYMALASLTARGSPVARSGPPWTVPSGRVASFSWRTRFCSRRSMAASFSAAFSATKNARVTPTCLGSVDGDVPGDILWRGVLSEQQVEALRGNLTDRALAARTHPDLRVWPLRGRRLDDDAVELPILALM